ncbi:MAG: LacI family transcriptional regulator [Firmicutes bacterium]|nr:LacI family transcriptional regulator [Bacillota bacterium]
MSQKRITIDDIARDLNVSKTTVSRAISGKGRISQATRDRIKEYIVQCNYRPSAAAKGLAESKTYNLALVLPKSFIQMDLPYVRESLNAICEEAFIWDYNILVCLSTDEYPESLLRTLDNRKVDGVILCRTVEYDALVDILTNRAIPFATLGSLPAAVSGKAAVEADHDQLGGCRALSTMVLQGCSEKVALIGNDLRYIVNQHRHAGFVQAVEAMKFPAASIAMQMNVDTEQECAQVVQSLYAQGFTRFVAMDDTLCLYTLHTLAKLDGALDKCRTYSMYDSHWLDGPLRPELALHFDSATLAQTACRELLRCLRGEVYDRNPILGYRIITR